MFNKWTLSEFFDHESIFHIRVNLNLSRRFGKISTPYRSRSEWFRCKVNTPLYRNIHSKRPIIQLAGSLFVFCPSFCPFYGLVGGNLQKTLACELTYRDVLFTLYRSYPLLSEPFVWLSGMLIGSWSVLYFISSWVLFKSYWRQRGFYHEWN